jgi:GNAT superfamily N-acetyltransferase
VDFPYDTNLGRTALGLGTYVVDWARKSGLAVQLYQEAGRLLKERGYKHYMGGHLVTNTQAQRVITRLGFEPLEVIGLFRLGD